MKEIKVNHLARVEGDGGITVEFDDSNKLKNVEINVFEGPRLIEALAEGKTADEVRVKSKDEFELVSVVEK